MTSFRGPLGDEEDIKKSGFVPLAPQPIHDAETKFISAIRERLQDDMTVRRAYLAICSIDRQKPEVVLGLVSAEGLENFDSITHCQEVFMKIFSSTESLATLALSGEQETELQRVGVTPFLNRVDYAR